MTSEGAKAVARALAGKAAIEELALSCERQDTSATRKATRSWTMGQAQTTRLEARE